MRYKPPMRSSNVRSGIVVALLGSAGCGLLGQPAPIGSGGGGVGAMGFGRPTVEVTINGVHFGPSAPANGSFAQVSSTVDPTTGAITDSTFRLSASSTAIGAACSLAVHRQGEDVAPIGVAGYTVSGSTADATADGSVSPVAGESVQVPQGEWQCTGTSCDGATFVLTGLDSAHAEGFLGGTFANFASGTSADVVCAFYVPLIAGN